MLIQESDVESNIHLDFVPMADVLFNLLIFFLLATTIAQVEREMKIALPAAGSAVPISAALREIVVNVENDGQITVAGRKMQADELRSAVADAVKQNAEQKVTVRGDRRTAYENVVRVLDLCKASGIQEPYIDTVME
jgi:biopolymer transport protein ExbD